jgi:hypothetical protein
MVLKKDNRLYTRLIMSDAHLKFTDYVDNQKNSWAVQPIIYTW